MSLNVSESIQQAIFNANHDFPKVIMDVADGFKRSGFFEKPNWKNMLDRCFENKRLGLTNEEIEIYASVLSDGSYEAAFVNGLTTSTPFGLRPVEGENRLSRSKRSSTAFNDDPAPPLPDIRKKFKKSTSSPDDIKVAQILVDLKDANWSEILPEVNAKQKTSKYVNVFEQSKQLKASRILPNKSISKRRNAIYIPPLQRTIDYVPVTVPKVAPVTVPNVAPVTVPKVVPVVSKPANTIRSVGQANPKDPENNAVLTNITNRRTTRRQTQLLAAYSGATSTTERRSTSFFHRTTVLFTMIDVFAYKEVLQRFNIFTADTDEKYDYLIAERICRSPKFLSAVVAGKPIVSTNWLNALKASPDWLDPLNFLLKDEEGEKIYNFNLANTLKLAANKKLFGNYSILVTPNTKNGPESLKGVIFSGGGKFLKTTLVPRKGDEVICVSDVTDKKKWPTLRKKYPTLKNIISLDGFSNMIFKYTHDVSNADVLQ